VRGRDPRAYPWGGLGVLVLLAFAAFEFVAERYLAQLTHAESVAVEFAIAVIVIFGARTVHRRVDRIVDGILFRTRHQQEHALRRFATTAQFYTAEAPLVRDALDAIVRFGRVPHAAIYLSGESTFESAASTFPHVSPSLDENDPALVEMRAHHEPVDIEGSVTAVPGVRAYPMILAGRLMGFVATGEREGGEAMPPDIDEAVKQVCLSTASALAAIETDVMRRRNYALQQRLDALTATP